MNHGAQQTPTNEAVLVVEKVVGEGVVVRLDHQAFEKAPKQKRRNETRDEWGELLVPGLKRHSSASRRRTPGTSRMKSVPSACAGLSAPDRDDANNRSTIETLVWAVSA